ncbi:MAG: carboxypeptidase-like regulatory domain-containing protein [Bacteroidota bacterium]
MSRILLLFVVISSSLASFSYDTHQEKLDLIIYEDFQEESLDQVFRKMHRKYNIYFSYNREEVRPYKVSAVIGGLSLSETMFQLLNGTPFSFETLEDRFVIITKKKVKVKEIQEVCGWIVDANSAVHLPYANIRVEGTPFGAVCDQNGKFRLRGNFASTKVLRISYLGYKHKTLSYGDLLQAPCSPIKLEREDAEIEGIVISEYLTDGISQGGHSIDLEPNKINAIPGLTDADIFTLAQNIPGIQSSTETAADFQIRGGSSDQTMVMLDGIPLYQTGHFFNMISAFNPQGIQEAKIYRTGYDASQAGRVSGLIQLEQGKLVPQENNRGVSLNLTHAGFFLNQANKKKTLGYRISGRYSYTNLIRSSNFSRLENRIFQNTFIGERIVLEREGDDDYSFNNRFNFSDLSHKIIWQPNDKHQFSISNSYSNNRLLYQTVELFENFGISDSMFQNNVGIGFNWAYQKSETYSIHTSGSLSYYSSGYRTRRGRAEPEQEFNRHFQTNNIKDSRIKHYHQWDLKNRNQFKLGAEVVKFGANYYIEDFDLGEELFVEEYGDSAYLSTLFAYFHVGTFKKWSIDPSFRVAYFDFVGEPFFDPRISIDYFATDHLTLKFHAGIYHQYMTQLVQWDFEEDYISLPIWVIANNDDISILSSHQEVLGFQYTKKGWLIDVELYHKYTDGLTSFPFNLNVNDPELDYIQGESSSYGLDVLVKKRWKNSRAWISYSLSQNQFFFDEAFEESFPSPFDQRHVLSLTGLFDYKAFHFAASYTYKTGRPFTELEGEVQEEIYAEGDTFYLATPVLSTPFSGRLPRYHRFDLSVFYKVPFKEDAKKEASVGLSILNVFNRENALTVRYIDEWSEEPLRDDEFNVNRLDKILLRAIPNLSIKFSW